MKIRSADLPINRIAVYSMIRLADYLFNRLVDYSLAAKNPN